MLLYLLYNTSCVMMPGILILWLSIINLTPSTNKALIAQLGERQTEDLKVLCSIHSQSMGRATDRRRRNFLSKRWFHFFIVPLQVGQQQQQQQQEVGQRQPLRPHQLSSLLALATAGHLLAAAGWLQAAGTTSSCLFAAASSAQQPNFQARK